MPADGPFDELLRRLRLAFESGQNLKITLSIPANAKNSKSIRTEVSTPDLDAVLRGAEKKRA